MGAHYDEPVDDMPEKKNGNFLIQYDTPPSVSTTECEEEKKEPKLKKVSVRQLWRYGSKKDIFLVFLGALVSIITGVGFPLMSVVVGDISQSFIQMTIAQTPNSTYVFPSNNTSIPYSHYYTNSDFKHDVLRNVIVYLIIGFAVLISAFVQVSCFLISGENVIHRTRKTFLKAIMRQDISWFDKHNSGTLTTKLFDNLERVQEGTGDKVGLLVQFLSQFFSGFIIAFTYDWKLTLIMLSVSPFLIVAGGFMARMMASSTAREAQMYAKAGAVAEQALTSIRTVVAFNGQSYECNRYDAALKQGKNTGIIKSFYIGLGLSATFIIMFSSYCLAFWVGTNFIANGTLEAKTVLTVFFSIMMSSMALGQAGQQFAVIGTAQGAAAAIFEIIDRTPEIDCYSSEGLKPNDIQGDIKVEDLEFSYPTRKDIKILDKISFDVKPGQTIALVGSSGCGKSTIVQLLLRYYDLDGGSIVIDGYDIKELNIKYLRKLIGVVSQEPILFNCSIEDNIKYGNDDISQSQMIAACRMANADNFIQQLPHGYKTIVGERGTQLSGGQKQRIAIARALVRNPKILLLDEATSALDAESESIVQEALDKARQGRTTIVIAHRLSTIKNADKIVAMKNGKVVEIGTHDILMKKKGLYHELVNAQVFADIEDGNERIARQTSVASARSRTSSISSVKAVGRRMSMTMDGIEDIPQVEDEKSVLKRLKQDLKAEGATESDLLKILKHARSEWIFLFIATLASTIQGFVFPMFSIFFTEIINVFSTTDMDKLKSDGHKWALSFLLLGGIQGVCLMAEAVLFGYSSERLTMRLRSKLFKNIMRMDIAYFDMPIHSSGKLSTRLATDCPNVRSAIDFRLGAVFSAFVSVTCGIGIGFYYGWQMALLMVALFPVVAIGRSLQFRYLRGKAGENARDTENAGNLALEAIENIRTVQALTLQEKFYSMFANYLEGPHQTSTRKHVIQGVTYGFSSSIMFFMNAASFGWGLYLILHHIITPMHVLRVLFAISFTGGTVGFAAAYFPEYNKAKIAAGIIFRMLAETPAFDSFSSEGKRTPIKGSVKLQDVHFSYPQRKEIKVLKGMNIQVSPGQTLALVGSSGCGKSTVVSLLERFYDPHSGDIVVDDEELKNFNLFHLRSSMALVSQEPILFDSSIQENILYGLDPNTVSTDEMIQAAKLANIHNFVSNLPSGYDTRVGEKGTQLSGGQKQRIAIARALVRNPKILLLDEATSALDTESEKIVQEALDRAREGRTCIVIAHRLATIINADKIAVVRDGTVLEQGTHKELVEKRGFYYRLTLKQNVQKEHN